MLSLLLLSEMRLGGKSQSIFIAGQGRMPKPKTLTREEWIKAGIIAAKELQRREDAKSAKAKPEKDKKKKDKE
jgi:hypothetical protein